MEDVDRMGMFALELSGLSELSDLSELSGLSGLSGLFELSLSMFVLGLGVQFIPGLAEDRDGSLEFASVGSSDGNGGDVD